MFVQCVRSVRFFNWVKLGLHQLGLFQDLLTVGGAGQGGGAPWRVSWHPDVSHRKLKCGATYFKKKNNGLRCNWGPS